MSPTGPWVVEVTRGELVESEHRVALVVLEPDGTTALRTEAVDVPMLPRSALKPAQAVAVLEALAGTTADLDDRELALAAGSHSGEPEHLVLAAGLLARHGLDADALGCPPARPLGVAADHAWGERAPERLAMNCSGKHAAMLAACVAREWPIEGYLAPEHPLQRGVRATLERLAGPVRAVTVDGCGAPAFATDLLAVARLGLALDAARADTPEGRVAAAMRAHPGLVAGPDRLDTVLMTVAPGALSKVGAEGVLLAVLPDGASLALAVVDGAGRAVGPVLLEVLRRRGLDHLDRTAELTTIAAPLVRGGGHPIGVHRVRS
ncbi:asparaginase [Actinomycetospora chibensis]|uniref:Asparaginase n=1 Tax=Actinomycetospora chibensis TaxID=663606 RepID=A0ABV9RPC0_9PSEU|nr:asparaginase [Actinomycetospora chibensis]MDD7922426.1 asparaginase [Actinomycetospora chibensis]